MGGWLSSITHPASLIYQMKLSWCKPMQSDREYCPKHWSNEWKQSFTTLTALLRSEFSSSACLPKELGGLPREFWRRNIGGVPGPRCLHSCWTSALHGDVKKIRVSETSKKKKKALDYSFWYRKYTHARHHPLPGGADQRLHLFHQVTANHVLVPGDPQHVCHGFSVERGVEDHDGSVYATIQQVFSKLLQGD